MKTLEQVIALMKTEIQYCVNLGQIPNSVQSFSELHDYADANEFGGFCDDNGITDQLIALHGGRNTDTEAMPDAVIDFMNAAQTAIDTWIKTGALLRE